MKSSPTTPGTPARRYMSLLLAYPLLALAGALTRWQVFPLVALLLLPTLVMLPSLLARRAIAWLIWLVLLGALLLLWRHGLADLALETVPLLISLLLAYWFGSTLAEDEPLIARFVIAIEGADRLQEPGVASYARHLTWFWTVLLLAQSLLQVVLLACAEHSGLLARFGLHNPWPIADRLASVWLHVGTYLMLGVVFLGEYAWRRWRFRHLSHPGLHQMMLQLAVHWPELIYGKRALQP